MQGHAGGKEPGHEGKGDALEPEGQRADVYDLRVVPAEEGHHLGGEEEAQDGQGQGGDESHPEEKVEGFPYPAVQPGAVVKAAHGLVALAKADDARAGEHGDPGDDAHGGYYGIAAAVAPRHVEQNSGQAGQCLPPERRQAVGEDDAILVQRGAELPEGQGDVGAPEGAAHQQAEAEKLA